ncbi:hypothetical protein HD806DRAFT_534418 [Xylariaceae sp. AK1471]|nr:hypothetical protein HD806DRAFT_534418 [Xylariaceae sp. AK1471]
MSSVSKNEGRQSPPPEAQSGAQMHDAPASGTGTGKADKIDNKDQVNQDQLKNLSSNPAGPMDATLEDKFSRGTGK